MRKRIGMFLMAGVILVALSGCEKTPEDSIITEKNKDNMSNYESGEDTGTPIREVVNAPEHYTNEVKSKDGVLTINTDAEVIVPEVSAIDTIGVSAKQPDQDLIDTITNTFFKDAKIYNGFSYYIPTKSKLEEKLTYLKKCKAEGNLDPYQYGMDDEGNVNYDIEASIARLEEQIKTAPEEVEKDEVVPQFNIPVYDEKDKENEISKDYFTGGVEMDGNKYSYTIQKDSEFMQMFQVHITRNREDVKYEDVTCEWLEARHFFGDDSQVNYTTTPEEIDSQIDMSPEAARDLADSKIDALGLENLELQSSDYALYYAGENGVTKDNVKDFGYMFYYARNIAGVPITYTINSGGCVEDMESTTVPWGYESCYIIVSDEGIEEFYLSDPYDIGEVKTENVKLMSFEEITKIYEQMMEISNASVYEYEKKRTYNVTRIELGYTRIYDPKSDNKAGVLVPVWDFFGGIDVETKDGYTNNDAGENSVESYMTINAIDGTIIDRSLGY